MMLPLVAGIGSCKKRHACTCLYTTVYHNDSEVISEAAVVEMDATRFKAKHRCTEQEDIYKPTWDPNLIKKVEVDCRLE